MTEMTATSKPMRSWEDLCEEVEIPSELIVPLASGRPELLMLYKRPMNAEEVGQLLNLLRVMMDTNTTLQQHCSTLSKKLESIRDNANGVFAALDQLADFADFRSPTVD